jgi:hypothetical protein
VPIKNFDVGNPASVSSIELNRYLNQQAHVVKAATESVISSTSIQNDDHLFLALAANTTYWFQAMLLYDGPAGNGMDMAWSFPSGATMQWTVDSLGLGASGTADIVSRDRLQITGTPINGTSGAGTSLVAVPKGILTVGSNSGTIRLRWAQHTTSSTAVRVIAGSIMSIRKLTP